MRHGKAKHRTRPARIRTRPIKGTGDDAGRYFNCSYCGFVCDIERDRLEGDNAKAGNGTQIAVAPSVVGDSPLDSSGKHVAVASGDVNFHHTTTELGMDGSPKSVLHVFEPVIHFGCPFCGTTNWKGK